MFAAECGGSRCYENVRGNVTQLPPETFTYVALQEWIAAGQALQALRQPLDSVLAVMSPQFDARCAQGEWCKIR
jgi:hypothetical protein